jgi:GR25 family glycosyltransferase involved in LPS biosynthesis
MKEILEFYITNEVDEDFDEVAYLKNNPEAKDLYKFYCLVNNVDDRHRLYYISISNFFNNNKESERVIKNNNLAILTTYFNPCNYVNLKYNYLRFSRQIKKFGDLFPVELSFDGNFFIEDENAIRVNGDSSNMLWQKEVLLNMALEKLPKHYTDVAWIDADIIFKNDSWVDQLKEELSKYKVVHLFKTAYIMNNEDKEMDISTSTVNQRKGGHPGFAWAARREIIDQIKFLDNQYLGGGDGIMCRSFIGATNSKSLFSSKGFNFNKETEIWMRNCSKIVDRSFSYLNTEITHLYHGSIKNRNYNERYESLKNKSDKIFKENKLWKADVETINIIKNHFLNRKEDDNIITVNNYFDHVYVLNLNDRIDRLIKVTNKLNSLGINFTRFEAINGTKFEGKKYVKKIFQSDKDNYAMGCCLSHKNIVKDAKQKGYKNILILEDDVMFCKNFNIWFQNLRLIKDWKLLYLGTSQYKWHNIICKNDQYFYRANYSYGTFAYGINNSVYDDILSFNIEEMPIDWHLQKIQKKYSKECYVSYPNLCIADVSDSNIRGSRNQIEHNSKMKWNIFQYE